MPDAGTILTEEDYAFVVKENKQSPMEGRDFLGVIRLIKETFIPESLFNYFSKRKARPGKDSTL